MTSLALSSLVLAGTYALLALAWVVIFRATGVLNFATGELMSLGAYYFYTFSSTVHWPFFVALFAALLSSALTAALIYAAIIRPLTGHPVFAPVLATIGLAIVIDAVLSISYGASLHNLPAPVSDRTYGLFGASISRYGLITDGVAVFAAVALTVFYRYSRAGLQMRAGSESPLLASQSGVRINWLFGLSWALGGVIAALGGIAYGYTNVVSLSVSQIGLVGIAPALIGGFDSVVGALIGGVVVAFVETYGVHWLGGAADQPVIFAVLLVFLLARPSGILGQSQVRRV
jgi:branched-chain amino acid transport system permease protein